MTIRILSAIGDPDAARVVSSLLHQLPDAEPAPAVADSVALLDALARAAAQGDGTASAGGPSAVEALPEVVVVHERIGPAPALELIREVALRFPAVGVVLITADAGPALFSAAMDAGARGVVGLPLGYEELAARVQAAAQWAAGVRVHLGGSTEAAPGPAGTLVTVTGAKGGVGTTVTAVQLALAARAAGRSVALVDLDLQSGDVASYLDVQFRRSVVDLAGIQDISVRVLQDAVHDHHTGLGLLLAPEEGERGEEVDDRAARQILGALRSRYEVVLVDCGSQMQSANAAAVELAETALLVTTPDVVAVRAAKRQVRLWDRLQIRKAEDTTTVVNRLTRNTEIQPPLVAKATGTQVARTHVPAAFKELQPCVDAGRLQDLDNRSTVKQALCALAAELALVESPAARQGRGSHRARPTLTGRKRKAIAAGAASGPGTIPGQASGPASGSGSGTGSGSGGRFAGRRGPAARGGTGPFDPAGPYEEG
ncbi:pilus assembly protein CpaE [Streptomyces sp. 2333.5]|uniref:AAA family ATPase n=1 Tax=unclassified Streptomyces TaxID=2593676 RepID=UPI000896471D|nr:MULTISPECIES: P-loop NTPase [unclassified Streptomyces]PJJ04115.1 pilus assembly protein CpaE [Streptomyces sp. 2333.5]SEE42904.1 pilus assembly protein CpaE [Streptomyces sp. 2314.4]SEE68328.1 pilus assembly protein CpaE [Streptomyces sp. 2112.2]